MTTRNVLDEIPTRRMGNLRVSTPETNNRNPLAHVIIDTSINNISHEYGTPTTSPDEVIIKQRGRRRVHLHWSPDIKKINSPQKTPTKHNHLNGLISTTTTMTLRSSPRKRLLENFSQQTTPEKIYSPRKVLTPMKNFGFTSAKKLKFEENSIIQSSPGTALNVALKGLSHEQLINIIQGLVDEQPELEKKVRKTFPVPDIKPLEDQIIHMKRNIFRSMPSSRLISKTDSTAYKRAAVHLLGFKKTIVEQSRTLRDAKHWDALLDYTMTAWYYVRSTPIWDNYAHNAVRRHCFKILSWHSLEALRNGGNFLGENRLIEFSSRLKDLSTDCEDINACHKPLDVLIQK